MNKSKVLVGIACGVITVAAAAIGYFKGKAAGARETTRGDRSDKREGRRGEQANANA